MELESFLKFNEEIKQLKDLYNLSSFSFESTYKNLYFKIKSNEINSNKILTKPINETASSTRDKFKKKTSKYLRELIFIRIISALEVFLVDTLRDVFLETHVPFMNNENKIDISINEILSYSSLDRLQSKILNKYRRQLTSGGLDDIRKYYDKIFEIDFFTFGEKYNKIEEYHDRRHLFVHALGKIDEQYRKKYNASYGKLEIHEDYLVDCFKDMEKFSNFIHDILNKKMISVDWKKNEDDRKSFIIKIHKKKESIKECDFRFKFKNGEKICTLQNLISSREETDEQIVLKLRGWEGELNRYYHILKKLILDNKIIKIECNWEGREWVKEIKPLN